MAEQFYTILTRVGKSKLANANALGTKLNLTKFMVGDGSGDYYNPTEEQAALKNKVWEGPINDIGIDKDNPNWMILQAALPGNIGGFTIRETGITDSDGDLIAIGKFPATYKPAVSEGSSKDITIKMILEVSNANSVTLNVDPTIMLATKEEVEVLQTDLNLHLDDSTSHVTSAERKTWNSKAEKTYVDEQIQTVTATGIPKLVTYEYDLYATVEGQTVFEIPYDYYSHVTDTLIIEASGIDGPKSYYTITDPVINPDNSITKGFITLTQGRPKDSFLKMRILKNVPIGPDGAIQGTILAIDSIPQNRIQNVDKIVQTDADGDIPLYKYKNRTNYVVNSTFEFGLEQWFKRVGVPTLTAYPTGGNGEGSYATTTGSTDSIYLVYETSRVIKVSSGLPVILSADMFSGGITSGAMFVEVHGYSSIGADLGVVLSVSAANGQNWKRYWDKATLPANVAFITVRIGMSPNTVNNNCAWRRIKLEIPTGDNTVLLPTPYSQESDVVYARNTTTQDITYYVDSAAGNDNNDGLSAGTGAFKTIGKAISVLPQMINHTVTISAANGSYNEDVQIKGFIGKGRIVVRGNISDINKVYLTGINIDSCKLYIDIQGFNMGYADNRSILVSNSEYIAIRYCNLTSSCGIGLKADLGSIVDIAICTVSAKTQYAIWSRSNSEILAGGSLSGSGNGTVLFADSGLIRRSGTMPSGSTATQSVDGGQII